MFCGCELSFGDEPNVHTCPICLAHPGTLPVPNERAIELALQIAIALGCEIAPSSIFHRKNYFYPDNPKAYQISQYDFPLATGGRLGEVRIHRVHLEEDAAKLVHHSESGRIHGSGSSYVDFNRGGTPLVEIVTEPDLRDPATAREWLGLLRTTIRQIGASDVNMEEGSLRCDANVSVRPAGSEELGTKTELKNMNSFRFIERGIAAEIERQVATLEAGGRIEQETLHFDPRSGELTPLRSKEYSHDYRYFPEPDLVPLAPTAEMLEAARAALPELPAERRERYESELGLGAEPATQLAFDSELGAYFERVAATVPDLDAAIVASWVTGELTAAMQASESDASRPRPEHMGATIAMVEAKRITHGAARQVLRAQVVEDVRSGRDRRARGARWDRGLERARGDRRSGDRGRARGRGPGPRRQREGDRAPRGPGHARDQGPRGRGRGHPPDPRAARRRLSRGARKGGCRVHPQGA